MKKSTRKGIIASLLILLLLSTIFVLKISSRHIKDNPPGTIGNTAGNLNNGGRYCESDGKVYFANAYDGYSLYSMDADETNIKKLTPSAVKFINAGGNYLYYYQTDASKNSTFSFLSRFSGVYRIKKKGGTSTCLTRDPAVTINLIDDYLYYQHYDKAKGTTLYKIKTDKTKEQEIADYIINPACVAEGKIYFNGTRRDHYLYTLDTATDTIQTLWEGNLWNPILQDGHVYYMDVENNYRICRYSLSDSSIEVVTEDRIDFFNIYGDYVYYQKSDTEEPALKRVHLDGQGEELIKEGVFEQINITSQYVYFNEFKRDTPVYKTSTLGAVNVTTFDQAEEAALKNLKK